MVIMLHIFRIACSCRTTDPPALKVLSVSSYTSGSNRVKIRVLERTNKLFIF